MGTKVKAPPARNYGKETRDTLQAQIDLMPDLYAAEQEFQPQFAQLQMDIAKSITPQLLDMYEETQPRLAAMDRQTLAAQREADIAAVEDLGPRAMDALDQMDTQKSGLMKTLMAQAQEEVDAGGSLTGREARQYQQNVRGSQAARGMGYGPSDALYEAAELQMGSERRQAQRRQNAMQTLAMRQATTADPFMAILGRPSAVNPMAAAAVAGQGQGYTPGQLFNPESGYANAIHAGNYQGKLAARTATAANKAAMWGAGISAAGNVLGAMASPPPPPGCWVAREVFGQTNPKWMAFYVWKEQVGPRWFKAMYDRYGEWFAKIIRNKPTIKNIIKNWMENRINKLNKG